jgi:glycosyltransferase involved in cell wall biosynthesis
VSIWRCYSYPAWHRSFFNRVLSFLSFMISSFVVALRVKEIDLVWGTSPPIFQGLAAWAAARLKGAAFLFEVRDLWPTFAVAVGVLRNPLLIRLSGGLERFLYARADRVVVNSPGYVAHVQARGAREVDLVANGVDVAMFDPGADGQGYRQANGLEGKFVAMYAGAHGLSNDLGVVLSAAERLRQVSEVVFVLVGDGKEKPALVAQARAMGLSNVRFLPAVPKAAVPEALAAADACIAILKPLEVYRTTYPNKVFDYMAAGRPVILAVDGVIRSMLEEAGAGIFVSPGDPEALASAVRRLASDRDLGREMGRAGRAYVTEHFDRPRLAAEMAGVMAATLEARRPNRPPFQRRRTG